MNSRGLSHPSDEDLRHFSNGKLDEAMSESINNHLLACAACQRRVSEMSSDSFLGRLRDIERRPEMSGSVQGEIRAPGRASRQALPIETLPPALVDHSDYEVVRELGRGGMGVVYLAHNKLMGRDEVLKVVSKHLIERKGVVERFSREIRSAARLSHPNIVSAYSASRYGESIVFAMEYVNGLDLANLVEANGPLPVAHACNFIYQAALGLQHAHEQGMVHRDIKPGNLMLARKGDRPVIKVLDFGLAKASRENPIDGGLTHEGQMLGTPDFIAPEQIRDAQSAGIQADIYSLGCTLYYLLTGAPPFEATSLYDLLQAHFSMDAQPLNLVRPEVPVELAALVGKMMAKEPARRFQTPIEVADALKPFFKKAGATAKPEFPTFEQPGPRPERTRELSAATAPLTPTPRKPVQSQSADSRSFSPSTDSPALGKISEPALSGSVGAVAAQLKSGSRPPRKSWPLVGAAGALGIAMLGVFIIIITNKGRMPIDTEKGNAPVNAPSKEPETARTPGEARTASPLAERSQTDLADHTRDDALAKPPASGIKPAPVSKNSIEMKLALIPEGEFKMGSPESDFWAEDCEKPPHSVRIAQPFYLGVYEVTQAQYRTVTGELPDSLVWFVKADDVPIYCISWKDALEFCNALSEKEGLAPYYRVKKDLQTGGDGYRLPTEAEWEYACRAGSVSRYFFGDKSTDLTEFAWTAANSDNKPHPVGRKQPNAFGLYDMCGNLAEFCFDAFRADSYKNPQAPGALEQSLTAERVVRGGGYAMQPRDCRSTARSSMPPEFRFTGNSPNAWGLRVARDFRPGAARGLLIDATPALESRSLGGSPDGHAKSASAKPTAAKEPAGSPTLKPSASPVADGSPEGVLRKHGLTQSGVYFVLASEAEILDKFEKIRPLIASMKQPFNMVVQAWRNEMLLAEAEEYCNAMQARVEAANGMLSKMPNGNRANSQEKSDFQTAEAARDQFVQERDKSSSSLAAMQAQRIPAERKEALVRDFKAKWSDFLKAADELTPLFDKALGEYRKLEGDSSVKAALAEVSRSTKAAALLGPSRNLRRAIDMIKEARRAYAPETAAPRKKGRTARRSGTSDESHRTVTPGKK